MRFLFTRRWLMFAVVVAGLAYLALILGQWQFHRLDDRRADNARLKENLARAAVPVGELLAAGEPIDPEDEWRRVRFDATYDDEHTLVLKYQTRDGAAGVDVVTPAVLPDGSAVLVDRGWMATANSGAERPVTPPPPAGTVSIVGWVRPSGTGRAAQITDLATRAISSEEAAKVLPYPLLGGFIDLEEQAPDAGDALTPVELPDDDSEGPHFFYGLQWWFFGALAVFGFGYLAYDEHRRSRSPAPEEPTQSEPSQSAQ